MTSNFTMIKILHNGGEVQTVPRERSGEISFHFLYLKPTWENLFKHTKFFLVCFYFWLLWVITAVHRSTGKQKLPFIFVHGFLIMGVSLIGEHRLQAHGIQKLQHAGAVVVAHGLSSPAECEIFLDQRSNSCPLHWQDDSYPLYHQESLNTQCFTPTLPGLTHWNDPLKLTPGLKMLFALNKPT